MSKANLNTPDREINPPDDNTRDCEVCNGTGDVIDWENEDEDDPLEVHLISCENCSGSGQVIKTTEDEDW
jgi:DnaJ-class molecular chaperone